MPDHRPLLAAIRQSYEAGDTFSTSCLADMLGEPERAVRGVVSWLAAAGALAVCGATRRRDRIGRPYRVRLYRLTGRDLPAGRIRRDPVEREVSLRMERDSRTKAGAADWLSRSWTAPPGP